MNIDRVTYNQLRGNKTSDGAITQTIGQDTVQCLAGRKKSVKNEMTGYVERNLKDIQVAKAL